MELISPEGRHACNKGHNHGDPSRLRYVSPGVRVSTRYINTTKDTALLSKTLICFRVHEPCSEDVRPSFQTTFKAYFPYLFKDHSSIKLHHTFQDLTLPVSGYMSLSSMTSLSSRPLLKAYFPYSFNGHSSIKLHHTFQDLTLPVSGYMSLSSMTSLSSRPLLKLTFHISSTATRL